MANHAVYLWQADAAGRFSLYTAPLASYLRGVQVSDANGRVTFTTIVPGAMAGRYPHFHIEIFRTINNASVGNNAQLKTQLILPAAVASAVYVDEALYPLSAANLAATPLASDPDFGDNSLAQNAALTPVFAGSVAAGYTAEITLGIVDPPTL
jgi:protocatechuate 3,4-dioxygenase beta subunit